MPTLDKNTKVAYYEQLVSYYENKKHWTVEEIIEFIDKKNELLTVDSDIVLDDLTQYGDFTETYYEDGFLSHFCEWYGKNFNVGFSNCDAEYLANEDNIDYIYKSNEDQYIINTKKMKEVIKLNGFELINGDHIQKSSRI